MFLNWFESFNEEEFLNSNIQEILKNPQSNNNEFFEMKNLLDKKCKKFISNCEEQSTINLTDLPNIEIYQKYVDNIKWYIDIYEKERIALENIAQKRANEFERYCMQNKKLYFEIQQLLESYKNLKLDLRKLEIKNQSLNEELSLIYNSRGWKYLEMVRKVFYE